LDQHLRTVNIWIIWKLIYDGGGVKHFRINRLFNWLKAMKYFHRWHITPLVHNLKGHNFMLIIYVWVVLIRYFYMIVFRIKNEIIINCSNILQFLQQILPEKEWMFPYNLPMKHIITASNYPPSSQIIYSDMPLYLFINFYQVFYRNPWAFLKWECR